MVFEEEEIKPRQAQWEPYVTEVIPVSTLSQWSEIPVMQKIESSKSLVPPSKATH